MHLPATIWLARSGAVESIQLDGAKAARYSRLSKGINAVLHTTCTAPKFDLFPILIMLIYFINRKIMKGIFYTYVPPQLNIVTSMIYNLQKQRLLERY